MNDTATTYAQQRKAIEAAFYGQMKPRPRLKVSEFAEKYRYIAPPAAETGPWRNSRTPYLVDIMDAANNPLVKTIVVMTAAQVGKSEALNNIMFYHMLLDPCPIMMIQPTIMDAEDYSKSRIMPTIRNSPELAKLFGDEIGKTRSSSNTVLSKFFPGGRLFMVGANSTSGLSGRAIRLLAGDEIDRYEPTKEGDTIALAGQRQVTFYNALTILTSTPSVKGRSAIEFWYEQSNKRNYFVPCPYCRKKMTLKWPQVVWDKGKSGKEHYPQTARYVCEHCGELLNDHELRIMVSMGEWMATAPFDGIEGFGEFPDLYSPWRTMEDTVRDFLRAQGDTEMLKVFVNTKLGQTWEDKSESISTNEIFSRSEDYGLIVPSEAGVVTAAVDVQDNRLEVLTVAWGLDEEYWALEHVVFHGSPGVAFTDVGEQQNLFGAVPEAPGVWNQLDTFLTKTYDHELGGVLPISVTVCDTGGHFTDNVYNFVKPRQSRGVNAIKGSSLRGKPVVSPPTTTNKKKVRLYNAGVFAAKEVVMSRLKIDKADTPGYMHFPTRFSEEFFEQLTAEKKITRMRMGRPIQEWVKIRPRNEAFDLTVYNLIALRIKYPTREVLNRRVQAITKPIQKSEDIGKTTAKPIRRKGGFVNRWHN